MRPVTYLWYEDDKFDDGGAEDEESRGEHILHLELGVQGKGQDDAKYAEHGHVVDAHSDELRVVQGWDSDLQNAHWFIAVYFGMYSFGIFIYSIEEKHRLYRRQPSLSICLYREGAGTDLLPVRREGNISSSNIFLKTYPAW